VHVPTSEQRVHRRGQAVSAPVCAQVEGDGQRDPMGRAALSGGTFAPRRLVLAVHTVEDLSAGHETVRTKGQVL